MNRAQFQQLAAERVRDADALLRAGQWSGAYYMAGYAIECALKACIAKLTSQHDYPDKNLAIRAFTHNIETLVEVADMKKQRDADAISNPGLLANWVIVKDWDVATRYQRRTEHEARRLFAAVSNPSDGVLRWIEGRW